MKPHFISLIAIVSVSFAVSGATVRGVPPSDRKLTRAYQVLAIHKSEIESELRTLSVTHNPHHPQVFRRRDELNAVVREMELIARGDIPLSKLSATFGGLVFRRAVIKGELKTLGRGFTSSHPRVLSKRNQLASLTEEINEILRS